MPETTTRPAYMFKVYLPCDDYDGEADAEANLLYALGEAEMGSTVSYDDVVLVTEPAYVVDPQCEECARSNGPHYRGPCAH